MEEAAMNSTAPEDLEAFKQTFRRHAAGVAIITSLDPEGAPVGFTATSLASLSAVPPLVTFNMARISSAWPAMIVGNRVAIHTLGARTQHLAETFAASNSMRFIGDHWSPGTHGVPIVAGVTAWMLGRIIAVHPSHNNAVVIVQIDQGELGEADDALLYYERGYHRPEVLVRGVAIQPPEPAE
jgi:flavin reductase (DIM6/NTAB) family NADH-FMN oxidoreductase RutF